VRRRLTRAHTKLDPRGAAMPPLANSEAHAPVSRTHAPTRVRGDEARRGRDGGARGTPAPRKPHPEQAHNPFIIDRCIEAGAHRGHGGWYLRHVEGDRGRGSCGLLRVESRAVDDQRVVAADHRPFFQPSTCRYLSSVCAIVFTTRSGSRGARLSAVLGPWHRAILRASPALLTKTHQEPERRVFRS
jgi:hypothetical protein